MKYVAAICVLTLLLTVQLLAQESPHNPELSAADSVAVMRFNSVGVSLDRSLNTFNWVGRARIDTTMLGTFVKIREQYTSNIILLDGGTLSSHKLLSDQQNLSLVLRRPLANDLSSEVQWSSLVYSDNKSVGLGQATFHSVLSGVEYSPFDFISLSPLVGYRWENQAGRNDKGLSYTMGMQTHSLNLDGYQLTDSAQFHEDRLNPRVLQRHFAHLGAQKYFLGSSRDSIAVVYSRNRREFYTIASGNIESRTESILSFSNLLDYELEPRFTTSLFVNIFNRSLNRDTRHIRSIADSSIDTGIDEFRLETFVQTSYKSYDGSSMASIRLAYGERNEQHSATPSPFATVNWFNKQRDQEESKDNVARRTTLAGMLQLPLSSSDKLFFAGSASILRYDTPNENNDDDRDELLLAISVSTTHRISRFLDIGVTLDGNVNHMVYLIGSSSNSTFSPSANNNVNRVLRLSPRATYSPMKSISSTNMFEVLANYTVYDFEQQVSDVRSYSYRQFGWMDSSSVQFTRRIGLDFFSYLKLYERGQLKWSDFSERTEHSFVDRTVATQVRFTPEEGLLFALGIRYFGQSRYMFTNGVKTPDSSIRSFGPTCLILWDVGEYSRVAFSGWFERRTFSSSQSQPTETKQSLPNMSMNITINL